MANCCIFNWMRKCRLTYISIKLVHLFKDFIRIATGNIFQILASLCLWIVEQFRAPTIFGVIGMTRRSIAILETSMPTLVMTAWLGQARLRGLTHPIWTKAVFSCEISTFPYPGSWRVHGTIAQPVHICFLDEDGLWLCVQKHPKRMRADDSAWGEAHSC